MFEYIYKYFLLWNRAFNFWNLIHENRVVHYSLWLLGDIACTVVQKRSISTDVSLHGNRLIYKTITSRCHGLLKMV
jgi:hypothetical protein